jgi:Fe-S cluster assembly protein SufD
VNATSAGRDFSEQIAGLFESNKADIMRNDSAAISQRRHKALQRFLHLGMPHQSNESWRNTDLEAALSNDYAHYFSRSKEVVDINQIFRCEVHNFETYLFSQLNGWTVYEKQALSTLPGGVIVGSLAEAIRLYPDIVEAHYDQYAGSRDEGLNALNTAFAQDGFFIYVPDNVTIEKPIQIVNIVNNQENIFLQPRNLIILGRNASLTLVHCDDSIEHRKSFINTVSEFSLGENASLDYYKLQNKDDESTVITSSFFNQQRNSRLTCNTITLNGGIIRNEIYVALDGEGAEADVLGLYLMDRKQHVDNQVFIDHIKPNTFSNELFKGILDDEASAVFNGYIHVRREAQKTNAFQNSRNILLTDTAKAFAKPFLEIYADDVKCSHGATVGQLDPEALFYIRSRGVCKRNARMLLMYAFAAEVVQKIKIEVLRERIDLMVTKRLKGELSICDQCVLHCRDNQVFNFDIDLSKV